MKRKQRILTVCVTLLAAGATAHLMQRGSADPASATPIAPADASVAAFDDTSSAARQPNIVTVAAAEVPDAAVPEPVDLPVVRPEPVAEEPQTLAEMPVATASVLAPPAAPGPAVAKVPAETAESSSKVEAPVTQVETSFPDMPRPPADAVTPTPLPRHGAALQSRMAALDAAPDAVPSAVAEPEVRRSAFGLSCGALLTASARPAAMVGLTLTDPCRGGETFTVAHGALTYAAALNDLGTYMAEVPALTVEASFAVRFEDGTTIESSVEVPEAAAIDRAALMTDGMSGLAIHALEFGADYEEDGHVWPDNPRDADAAAKAGGGFLTVLGDADLSRPQLAQVYTFPSDTRARQGVVRLSIETEVTERNCAHEVVGQTLQIESGRLPAPVSLTLSMPDCDAIGEFLVLKNLLRDLKIASN